LQIRSISHPLYSPDREDRIGAHVCSILTNEFKAPWVRLSVAKLRHIRNVRKVGVTLERKPDPEEYDTPRKSRAN
jgi:hypothetical protein